MSNMRYCRFENTVSDLKDCKAALERLLNGDEEERGDGRAISRNELRHAKSLVYLCQMIVELVADEAEREIDDLSGDDIEATLDEANVVAEKKDQEEQDEARGR
jgi:hypothetical protein